MDFGFTKEQDEIRKAVRGFCKGEFTKEIAYECDQEHKFPEKIWKKAAKLGFIGINFPEKYSGQGLGVTENVIVFEELCRADSTIGSAIALTSFASECILHFGSDEMKKRLLPLITE